MIDAGHVDQAGEVRPLEVEAVPARAECPLAVAITVELAAVVDVVFAGNIVDLLDLRSLEDLGDVVELARLRQVREVAGVDGEGRACRRALILSTARFRVPRTSALAGRAKPMWLSLSCTKVKSPSSCAVLSWPKRHKVSVPPLMVQATPAGPGHAGQEATPIDAVSCGSAAGCGDDAIRHAISLCKSGRAADDSPRLSARGLSSATRRGLASRGRQSAALRKNTDSRPRLVNLYCAGIGKIPEKTNLNNPGIKSPHKR